MHVYEVRPRQDHRGFDLVSDALPFGKLWYDDADAAVGHAKFYSRSHPSVIRIYNSAGAISATVQHAGEFRER